MQAETKGGEMMGDFLSQTITIPIWLGTLITFFLPWAGVYAYRLGQKVADREIENE